MKNLLIYVNPKRGFDENYNNKQIVELQIENSLSFCKPEDMILVTNFPYEHMGVKSLVVPDELYCTADPTGKATKIDVIIYLIENNLLSNELIWFRDLDAFQLSPVDVNLKKGIGITSYEWKDQWNTGSFFFTKDALTFFKFLKEAVYKYKMNEEPALGILTKENFNNINSLYEKLNVTYNIGMRCTRTLVKMAEKPIKIAHFPPHDKKTFEKFKPVLTVNLINLINIKYNY